MTNTFKYCNSKLIFLAVLFILCSAARSFAQYDTITLGGYPLSTAGWDVGADAFTVDSEVDLTGPSTSQQGYLYDSTAVNLTGCGQFTVDFDFEVVASGTTTIADGIVFWYINNPPTYTATSGVPGSQMGLPLYPDGLLLVLDTYDNVGLPDLNPKEVLAGYNGTEEYYVEGSSTGLLAPVNTLESFITDGSWHHCKITYNLGHINVYFNNSTTASLTGYYPLTFTGYFGFSASTGALYSTQAVKDVRIVYAVTPQAPAVTSPVSYCQNQTASPLTATGVSDLRWYTTDTATVDTLTAAPTPSTDSIGTTYYYVRQDTGICQSPPDSIAVVVSTQPAPPVITGDTFYCTGETYVPISATGTGITWYTADTGGTGSTTVPVIATSVAGTYTYFASQSLSGCQSARDSITVVVNTTPAAPALTGGDTVYCQYQSFVPFTVSGSSLTWYPAATGGVGTTVAPVVNTGTSGSYDFYVTQSDSGCESPRLSIPVVVNAMPAPPAVVPPVYCQNDVAAPLSASGSYLLWFGPGISSSGTYATPVPATADAGTYTYYVTQTISGCSSDSAADVVTVKATPPAPITADTAYCQFVSVPPLTAGGTDLQWYTSPGGGAPLPSAPIPSTATVGPSTWYVDQQVDGCVSSTSSLTVTVYSTPQFTISPATPAVCQFDSLTFAYIGGALTDPSYKWVLPAGASFVGGTANGTPTAIVRFDTVQANSYIYLTATNDSTLCSSTDSVIVLVQAQPSANPATKKYVCLGDTVMLGLQYESADALQYQWTIDSIALLSSPAVNIVAQNSNSGGPYSLSWLTPGVHIIQLNTTSSLGCRSPASFDTVQVRTAPVATFSDSLPKGELCIQDSVLFTATDVNQSYLYTWAPAHSFNNVNSPSAWGRVEEANSVISLTVTDPQGCSATADMTFSPGSCCSVIMPNAFTPNNDGNNDFFRPIFEGYHTFHAFRVTNRWGQVVFESAGSEVKWDGNFNGVPQDMGTYFYYISFDCGGSTVEQKGDVVLIR